MRGDEFGQIVEYVTRDGVWDVSPDVFALDSVPTLEAVKADYEKVAALGRAKALDVQAVKAAASAVYHADVVNNEIVSSDPVEVVERLLYVRTRPEWWVGADVTAGDVWLYEGNLYRVVQSHKVEATWTPTAARALWTRYYESDETPEWVQPTGAHDAWPLGARVMFGGEVWISTLANNVWQPGVTGWTREGGDPVGAWSAGVAYNVGDRVSYQGSTYECRQAHTSQAGWTPVAVPALWLKL